MLAGKDMTRTWSLSLHSLTAPSPNLVETAMPGDSGAGLELDAVSSLREPPPRPWPLPKLSRLIIPARMPEGGSGPVEAACFPPPLPPLGDVVLELLPLLLRPRELVIFPSAPDEMAEAGRYALAPQRSSTTYISGLAL